MRAVRGGGRLLLGGRLARVALRTTIRAELGALPSGWGGRVCPLQRPRIVPQRRVRLLPDVRLSTSVAEERPDAQIDDLKGFRVDDYAGRDVLARSRALNRNDAHGPLAISRYVLA